MFDDEALEASTVLLFSLLHFLYCPIAHAPGKHGIRASALQLSWAARCVMCSSAALVGNRPPSQAGGLLCRQGEQDRACGRPEPLVHLL